LICAAWIRSPTLHSPTAHLPIPRYFCVAILQTLGIFCCQHFCPVLVSPLLTEATSCLQIELQPLDKRYDAVLIENKANLSDKNAGLCYIRLSHFHLDLPPSHCATSTQRLESQALQHLQALYTDDSKLVVCIILQNGELLLLRP